MSDVTVRPRTPDDDDQIVHITNQVYPGVPRLTVEHLRYGIEIDAKHEKAHVERHVAVEGERIVGYMIVESVWFLQSPGAIWIEIRVEKESWGRGIGSTLYDLGLRRARDLDGNRLYGEVRDDIPEADRFATHRAFKRTGHGDRLSYLDVHAANLDGYTGLEERLAQHGIRVTSLAELDLSDDFLHAVYSMEHGSVRDIPSTEEISEARPFELWRESTLNGPGRSPDSFFVALEGTRPVGVARLKCANPKEAWNGYTGVDRAYRGRGVARGLKLRTILWARENGVDRIYTGNDPENARMLSINIRLGYTPLPTSWEVVKAL